MTTTGLQKLLDNGMENTVRLQYINYIITKDIKVFEYKHLIDKETLLFRETESHLNIIEMLLDTYKFSEILIEYFVSKFPDIITDRLFSFVNIISTHKKKNLMLKNNLKSILIKYDTMENNDILNTCYVCLSQREQEHLLTNICCCKSYVHFECVKKLLENNEMCKTCAVPIKRNILVVGDPINLLYFPSSNYYYNRINGSHQFAINKIEQFGQAIMNLQIREINCIIREISNDDFIEFIKYYNNSVIIYKFEKIKIMETMCSNLKRNHNLLLCIAIETELNKKLKNI